MSWAEVEWRLERRRFWRRGTLSLAGVACVALAWLGHGLGLVAPRTAQPVAELAPAPGVLVEEAGDAVPITQLAADIERDLGRSLTVRDPSYARFGGLTVWLAPPTGRSAYEMFTRTSVSMEETR